MDPCSIEDLPALAPIAGMIPSLTDHPYSWQAPASGARQIDDATPVVLIEPGREEGYYSFHPSVDAAKRSLAASISEGSFDFYESDAHIVDSRDGSALRVTGIGADGLITR